MSSQSIVQGFVTAHRNQWQAVVAVAYHVKPDCLDQEAEVLARATGATKATIRRKFEAVAHKRLQGWTEERIIAEGQGPTLSAYSACRKRERTELDIILRYRVTESLGDSWLELQTRLSRIARLNTSQDLIEFLHSCFADLTDREIRHLAGLDV
jgi:hypothetical protein